MKTNLGQLGLMICLFTVSSLARSEVTESSASSFKVKHVQTVTAKPEKAWQSFLAVDKWWSGEHTYSGSAANLRLDARAGGCFCETAGERQALHMTVGFVDPGHLLRMLGGLGPLAGKLHTGRSRNDHVAPNQRLTMTGGLGPLQTSGASGAMTFQIVPQGEGSNLTLVYEVGGFYPGGLAAIASGVDGVLGEQFARLKRLIETGEAAEKKPGAAGTKPEAAEKKPPK